MFFIRVQNNNIHNNSFMKIRLTFDEPKTFRMQVTAVFFTETLRDYYQMINPIACFRIVKLLSSDSDVETNFRTLFMKYFGPTEIPD